MKRLVDFLEPVAEEIRRSHSQHGDLSRSEFREAVKKSIGLVSNLKVREAVHIEILAGPASTLRIDSPLRVHGVRIRRALNEAVYRNSCKNCGAVIVSDRSPLLREPLTRFCSTKCSANNIEVRKNIEETFLRRYGATNPNKSPAVRAKARKTIKSRYGVDNVSQIPEVKQAKMETCAVRYGVSNPSKSSEVQSKKLRTYRKKYGDNVGFGQAEVSRLKRIETCNRRYGLDSTGAEPSRLAKVAATMASRSKEQIRAEKDKAKATFIRKYGVDHPMKDSKIRRKVMSSAYSSFDQMVCGKLFKDLQGYEGDALQFLSDKIPINRIHAGSDPRLTGFKYHFLGKDRTYYPDILVNKTYFEVKSTYTAGIVSQRKNESYEMLRKKMLAVESRGYRIFTLIKIKDERWVVICGSQTKKKTVLKVLKRLKSDPSREFLLAAN